MDEPADRARSDLVQDRYAGGPRRRGRPGRRLPEPARNPAGTQRTDVGAWRGHRDVPPSIFADPYGWFHRRVLAVLGSVASTCGVVNLVTLGADAPGGWELALRLLSTALVATALVFCVLAVRRRDPRRGHPGYPILAVAALIAAVAVVGLAAWTST